MKLDDGRERRCHQDQIRKRTVAVPPSPDQTDAEILEDLSIPSSPKETPAVELANTKFHSS